MIDASSVSTPSAWGHFKERWRATSKNDEKDGDRKYIDSHLPMGEVEPGRDPLPETRGKGEKREESIERRRVRKREGRRSRKGER